MNTAIYVLVREVIIRFGELLLEDKRVNPSIGDNYPIRLLPILGP